MTWSGRTVGSCPCRQSCPLCGPHYRAGLLTVVGQAHEVSSPGGGGGDRPSQTRPGHSEAGTPAGPARCTADQDPAQAEAAPPSPSAPHLMHHDCPVPQSHVRRRRAPRRVLPPVECEVRAASPDGRLRQHSVCALYAVNLLVDAAEVIHGAHTAHRHSLGLPGREQARGGKRGGLAVPSEGHLL